MKQNLEEIQEHLNRAIDWMSDSPPVNTCFTLGRIYQICEELIQKLSQDDIPDPEDQIGE